MTDEEILNHEAGHACAALILKLPIKTARRWDPDPMTGGGVSFSHGIADWLLRDGPDRAATREQARRYAIMLLAGPIMGDSPDVTFPEWPLDREARQADERQLAVLADYLDLDESGWRKLLTEAWEFTCRADFCILFEAVTGYFERMPTLDESVFDAAVRIAEDRK